MSSMNRAMGQGSTLCQKDYGLMGLSQGADITGKENVAQSYPLQSIKCTYIFAYILKLLYDLWKNWVLMFKNKQKSKV